MNFSSQPPKSTIPRHPYPPRRLTEEDILDRLERLFNALDVPDEFRVVILEILCCDSMAIPATPVPTAAMPGTMEKLEVMAARAARGECVFHEDDSTWHPVKADRLFQFARNYANGASARLEQPLLRASAEGEPQPVRFTALPEQPAATLHRPRRYRKAKRRQATTTVRMTQRFLF